MANFGPHDSTTGGASVSEYFPNARPLEYDPTGETGLTAQELKAVETQGRHPDHAGTVVSSGQTISSLALTWHQEPAAPPGPPEPPE